MNFRSSVPLPFVPTEPEWRGLAVSIILCSTDDPDHREPFTRDHDTACWAVSVAMNGSRHRLIKRVLADLADTAWLVHPEVALIATVLDNQSPWGVLYRWPDTDAPQMVWWADSLYQRHPRSGLLTYVGPCRFGGAS